MTEFITKWDAWGLFGDEAQRYDATVKFVAPCYEQMHKTLLELSVEAIASIGSPDGLPLLALDIGSGTGAEAIPLLKEIPTLRIIGLDSSSAMNEVFLARAKKAEVSVDRFSLVRANILDASAQSVISKCASEAFGTSKFQIITSAFTLHHFTKDEKAATFSLIHKLLAPGGVFFLGDLFNYDGESIWLSETISAMENDWWADNFDRAAEEVKRRGDATQASALRKLRDKWLAHYAEENHLDSVSTQVSLLKDVGFHEIGNPFRYWQVGLLFAKKSKE